MTRTFHERTAAAAPSPLLVMTLSRFSFASSDKRALDLGCGSGRDTRLLLASGWQVTALDQSAEALAFLKESVGTVGRTLSVRQARFEEMALPSCEFDLVSAMFALPFCAPFAFADFWQQVTSAIAPAGILCCHFFGPRDSRATDTARVMSFHDRAQIEELLTGFAVAHFHEVERDSENAMGIASHWHAFEVVAQKVGRTV